MRGCQPLGWAVLGALHLPKTVPKLLTNIFDGKINKVLPRKDAIYMVPRPLQKLSGDSPLC